MSLKSQSVRRTMDVRPEWVETYPDHWQMDVPGGLTLTVWGTEPPHDPVVKWAVDGSRNEAFGHIDPALAGGVAAAIEEGKCRAIDVVLRLSDEMRAAVASSAVGEWSTERLQAYARECIGAGFRDGASHVYIGGGKHAFVAFGLLREIADDAARRYQFDRVGIAAQTTIYHGDAPGPDGAPVYWVARTATGPFMRTQQKSR
jgi:hypothetical protein